MLRILVTGGAGFIGSNFVRCLLETRPNCQVINLDKLTYAGNLDNLRDIEEKWGGSRHFFVKGDIVDRRLVSSLFERPDLPNPNIIVNFAAESHVDRSILDASPFIDSNIKGVQRLLDAAREYKAKKFIQVSTDEVYGSLALTGDGKFTEDYNLLPNSPYSASKAAADLLCKAYYKTYGLPVVVTRCCNNYGPHQFPEKLIPLMILNSQEGKPLPVYGDGQHVREWIHVLDHCRAIDFLIDQSLPGDIYNIGTGYEIPNIEAVKTIVNCVAELTGKNLDELEDLITFVKDRPGHDRRYAINADKLKGLGWTPKVSFAERMKQTVAWYLKHTAWCFKVRSGEYREYYKKWYGSRIEEQGNTI